MEKIDSVPIQSDWTEVIIEWKHIQNPPYQPILDILEWIEKHESSGRYQMRGYKATEGFEFRFEDPQDATYFVLKWL